MAKVQWSQGQHILAKQKRKPMICVALNGKYAERGSYTFTALATPEMVKLLDRTLTKIARLAREGE